MQKLIVFSLFLIFSCQQPDKTTSSVTEKDIVPEVKKMLNDYVHAIASEGLLAEFRFLDSSENFFWVPPGYTSAISYDSVATILRKNHSVYTFKSNEWETLRVIQLSNNLANYTGVLVSVLNDSSSAGIT
ncbi:MAG: hypothetical protein ACHQF2_06035, partial [Flavobacteriales bacterium]